MRDKCRFIVLVASSRCWVSICITLTGVGFQLIQRMRNILMPILKLASQCHVCDCSVFMRSLVYLWMLSFACELYMKRIFEMSRCTTYDKTWYILRTCTLKFSMGTIQPTKEIVEHWSVKSVYDTLHPSTSCKVILV